MPDEQKDPTADVLYDVGRMSEMSAFMDHEVQRLVVLLKMAPDAEARALIFKACGPQLPKFLEMAEQFRGMGVGFMRLNEAIDRLLKEGLLPEAQSREVLDEQVDGRGPPLSPSQIDPVFAEGIRQMRESQDPGNDEG